MSHKQIHLAIISAGAAMKVEKPPIVNDKRSKEHRKGVLGSGRIVHSNGAANIACTIRDISKGGARVRLSAASPLPKNVYFIDLARKTAFSAEIAWRNGPHDIGLKFVEEHPLNLKLPQELKYLNRIWIEVSAR
jgi:hypothetical protein